MGVFKGFYQKIASDYQAVECSVWIYNITKVIQYGCSLHSNHMDCIKERERRLIGG